MIVWEGSSGGLERELAAKQQLLADATARAGGKLWKYRGAEARTGKPRPVISRRCDFLPILLQQFGLQ
jgi:hypothetical protein